MTAIALNPCHCCHKPAKIVPALKRGFFKAECSEEIDCPEWPMTDAKPSEEEAAQAWNNGDFATYEHPAANAE